MLSDILKHAPLEHIAFAPALALIVFVALAVAVMAWTFRPGSSALYQKMSQDVLHSKSHTDTSQSSPLHALTLQRKE